MKHYKHKNVANFENFEVYQRLHLQEEFFHSPEVHEAGCLLRVRPRCACTLLDAWDESAVYKSGLELCRLRPAVQMWWTIVAPQILEPFYDLSNKFVKIKLAFLTRTISKSGNTQGIWIKSEVFGFYISVILPLLRRVTFLENFCTLLC